MLPSFKHGHKINYYLLCYKNFLVTFILTVLCNQTEKVSVVVLVCPMIYIIYNEVW